MSAVAETQDLQELLGRVRVRRARGRLRRAIYWWPVAVLLVIAFVAAFPGLIAPHAPNAVNFAARLKGPGYSLGHTHYLLGTDDLGRDLLSRVIWGARAPVEVALAAVLLAGVVGTAIGVIAASFPRVLGAILMRIADMVLSIPFLLLAILIATVLGPSIINLVIVLALSRWPRYTRVAYAQTREAFQQEFVRSAVALGARRTRVLLRHVLPEVLPPLIVVATLEVGLMVITEASLSFLGLGVQPPTADWGAMLSEGEQYISTAWWISTFPGIAIFILVLAINRLGDRVRDRLDPRERTQSL
jgi:peptide/nickel transport system permease protein